MPTRLILCKEENRNGDDNRRCTKIYIFKSCLFVAVSRISKRKPWFTNLSYVNKLASYNVYVYKLFTTRSWVDSSFHHFWRKKICHTTWTRYTISVHRITTSKYRSSTLCINFNAVQVIFCWPANLSLEKKRETETEKLASKRTSFYRLIRIFLETLLHRGGGEEEEEEEKKKEKKKIP